MRRKIINPALCYATVLACQCSSAENRQDCHGSDAGTVCVLLPAVTAQDALGFGPSPARCRFLWRPHGCILLTSMLPAPQARGAEGYRPALRRIHAPRLQPPQQLGGSYAGRAARAGARRVMRHAQWPKRGGHVIPQSLARSLQEFWLCRPPRAPTAVR